jgi:bifunctional non-homologous end joining protein LigD
MSRNGHDLAGRFPQIVEAVRTLPVQSCVIDGEAIVTDDKGLAVFALLGGHGHNVGAELCAFDIIELDGEDLRRVRIEERKRKLTGLLGRFQPGIVVNEYFEGDGAIIYKHACTLGCEGIVSKRLGTPYRAGHVLKPNLLLRSATAGASGFLILSQCADRTATSCRRRSPVQP